MGSTPITHPRRFASQIAGLPEGCFCHPIQNRRKELKVTQRDLASQVGLNTSTISLYESGTRIPSINTLEKIAKALQTNLARVFGEGEYAQTLERLLQEQALDKKDIQRVKHYIEYLRYLKTLR